MIQDLSNLKIDDSVWSIIEGATIVSDLNGIDEYSISTKSEDYTIEGKRYPSDKYQSLFHTILLECIPYLCGRFIHLCISLGQ